MSRWLRVKSWLQEWWVFFGLILVFSVIQLVWPDVSTWRVLLAGGILLLIELAFTLAALEVSIERQAARRKARGVRHG